MAQPDALQKKLLAERRIASVATVGPAGMPHLTSVWFLYEDEALYLAISSMSVKGRNLAANAKIAIMIDERAAYQEAGLTAVGEAQLLSGEEAAPIVRRVHEKYLSQEALADPHVGPVFAAIDDVAVKLVPRRWISWDMGEIDQQAFGGAIARNRYLREVDP